MRLETLIRVRDQMGRKWPWLANGSAPPSERRGYVELKKVVVNDSTGTTAVEQTMGDDDLLKHFQSVVNEDLDKLVERAWDNIHERIEQAKAKEIARIERMGT